MNKNYIFGMGMVLAVLAVLTAPAMAWTDDVVFYLNTSDGSHEISVAPDTEVTIYLDAYSPVNITNGFEVAVLFDPDVVECLYVTENESVTNWMAWTFRGVWDATPPGMKYINFDALDFSGQPPGILRNGDIHLKSVGPGVTTMYLGVYPDDVPDESNRTSIGLTHHYKDWTLFEPFTFTCVAPTYTISGYTDPAADTAKITNLNKSDVVDERSADYIDPVTGFYNLTLDVTDEVEAGNVLRITACDVTSDYGSNCNVSTYTVVNAPGEDINVNLTLNHYCLDLVDFPMHEANTSACSNPGDEAHKMCGPATAQMNLDYMWWNSSLDPEPPVKYNQSYLYEYGLAHNENTSLEYFDARGMWYAIQYLDPSPYSEYGYNFGLYHNTDGDAMMKSICHWLCYTVGWVGGHKDGHPYHVPGAVPAYGGYTNWMSIRGLHTNKDAAPSTWETPADLEVYGFWVNDPYPATQGGIGENSFKTAEEWNETYYKPLETGDAWDGKYVAILEPPEEDLGDITTVSSKARFTEAITPALDEKTLMVYGVEKLALEKVVRDDEMLMIVAAAIDGVTEELIPYDAEFAEVFAKTVPGAPMLVSGDNGDYYIVPFNVPVIARPPDRVMPVKIEKIKTSGLKKLERLKRVAADVIVEPIVIEPIKVERTLVVVVVDAEDGSFKEASWVADPVKYLPVSKVEALKLALGEIDILSASELSKLITKPTIELVYRDASPYYPDWKVTVNGEVFYVSQDGTVSS